MERDRTDITAQLFAQQDKAYADFQSKLLPTVARETVIGVRLRKGSIIAHCAGLSSHN